MTMAATKTKKRSCCWYCYYYGRRLLLLAGGRNHPESHACFWKVRPKRHAKTLA